jgi:hypothetical protein
MLSPSLQTRQNLCWKVFEQPVNPVKTRRVKATPTVESPSISVVSEVKQVMLCMSRQRPRRGRKRRLHIRTYNILGTRPFKIKFKSNEIVRDSPSDSGVSVLGE